MSFKSEQQNVTREEIIDFKLEEEKEELALLSKEIWNKPELNFQEYFAHDLLTEFLELRGFSVQRNYILPTAFRAEFQKYQNGSKNGVTGIVMCEYDALPIIGHACGHNLIAEVGVACGLAVKSILENCKDIFGKIVVLGTPAEEGGGGKIHLLKGAAFDNADFAIMAHPSLSNVSGPGISASYDLNVQFHGKESHAGLCPWDGLNSLDASVACYNNVSLLRQQLKTDARINIAIRDCGHAINVIPKQSKMDFLIRTSETSDLQDLVSRVQNCIEGAAKSTGCTFETESSPFKFYKHLIQNEIIENQYILHAKKLGLTFMPNEKRGPASDCGNVSHFLPTLHPVFHIGANFKPHTESFANASQSVVAQAYTIRIAKVLALTFTDFLIDPELVILAKSKFLESERSSL